MPCVDPIVAAVVRPLDRGQTGAVTGVGRPGAGRHAPGVLETPRRAEMGDVSVSYLVVARRADIEYGPRPLSRSGAAPGCGCPSERAIERRPHATARFAEVAAEAGVPIKDAARALRR